MSGHKIKVGADFDIKDGRRVVASAKPKNRPAKYRAKTRRTWRPTKKG